jgi:oligopeptide transport system substrate-binding protein
MTRLLVPFVLLIAIVGLSVISDRPAPRADIAIINRGDLSTMDVQTMTWMQDFRIARLVFEGLVRADVFTPEYTPRPGVAERWEISADKRVWTFHLRREARWTNGEPVTSADFLYAWRRALLPDVAADYVQQVQLIRGGREFYAWREKAMSEFAADRALAGEKRRLAAEELWRETERKFGDMVGASAPDPHTLVVQLVRPTPFFLDLVWLPVFYPVCAKVVAAYERVDADSGRVRWEQEWTKPPGLVSNGPFKMAVWRFKRDMRLERNELFWDRGLLNIDSIAIPSIEDANAQVLAFQTGTVDWVSDVVVPYRSEMIEAKRAFYREHAAEYERLKAQGLDQIEIDRRLPADPRNRIHVIPAFGTYFYNFNCLPRLADGRENPFHDPRVRRAFGMAIDKKTLTEQVRRLGEPVASTIVPPKSIGGYRSPRGLEYDPEVARKLLAECGYPGGKGFITVEMLFNKEGGHDLIAQAIAKNWEQNLGVSVLLLQKEIKVFREDLKSANYMTSRAGWFADFGDPVTFMDIHRTGDGNNDRKYSSPRFDAMLDAAANEVDARKRMRILEEAERFLVEEEMPVVPLFHYCQIYLFDPHKLTGISSHPRQDQVLYWCDVLGDGKGRDVPRMMPAGK